MQKTTSFKLLTFYKFVDIENPEEEVKKQKQYCQDIGMKGRIFIGEEGINAQITCNKGQEQAYRIFLENSVYFKDIPDIDIKAVKVDEHKFPKMIVRYRKEIVALGVVYKAEEILKSKRKLSVDEFKKIMDSGEDKYAILDMRNNYEFKLGHFKNAVPADTISFREVTQFVDKYKEQFAGKEIIMYCTGGIRCEKLSVLLDQHGLPGVYQLDGGVVKYVNSYNDGNWLGNLYTFDDRISSQVGDEKTHRIISRCHFTGEPNEDYHNCRYGPCNAQIIAKPKAYRKHLGFCSEDCAKNAFTDLFIRDVKWDPINYKELRGKIKQNENKREEVTELIQSHLKKWLAGIEFNHKFPLPDIIEVEN
jgi:UPF0176 protein